MVQALNLYKYSSKALSSVPVYPMHINYWDLLLYSSEALCSVPVYPMHVNYWDLLVYWTSLTGLFFVLYILSNGVFYSCFCFRTLFFVLKVITSPWYVQDTTKVD